MTPKGKKNKLKFQDVTAVDWLCNFLPHSVKINLAHRIEEAREIEKDRIERAAMTEFKWHKNK